MLAHHRAGRRLRTEQAEGFVRLAPPGGTIPGTDPTGLPTLLHAAEPRIRRCMYGPQAGGPIGTIGATEQIRPDRCVAAGACTSSFPGRAPAGRLARAPDGHALLATEGGAAKTLGNIGSGRSECATAGYASTALFRRAGCLRSLCPSPRGTHAAGAITERRRREGPRGHRIRHVGAS